MTEADLAADRIIAEGLARLAPEVPALSEERVDLAKPPYRRQLLPDRSARRHQGIRRRPRRVHRQPRAGDRRHAAVGHRRRARARTDLARPGRPRRRAADGRRRRGRGRPSRSTPAASRARRALDRRRSAARMAMPGPKPSSRRGPARSARCSARRSNSAGWRKAAPISIRALRRPREWDIAAGHAVVTAAGGKITDAQGRRLAVRRAARSGFIVPEFIAWGDPAAAISSDA